MLGPFRCELVSWFLGKVEQSQVALCKLLIDLVFLFSFGFDCNFAQHKEQDQTHRCEEGEDINLSEVVVEDRSEVPDESSEDPLNRYGETDTHWWKTFVHVCTV